LRIAAWRHCGLPVAARDTVQSLTDDERERFGFDERFEDRWWRTEVAAWMVMAVIVAAGVIGVLGRGPLARTTANAGPLSVEYERVVRYQTPTRITVSIADGRPDLRIFISRSLLERVQLQSVQPLPTGSEPRSDGAVLLFAGSSAGGRVTLVAQGASIGPIAHTIAVNDRSLGFTQVALP
jgi:hypothetical protein